MKINTCHPKCPPVKFLKDKSKTSDDLLEWELMAFFQKDINYVSTVVDLLLESFKDFNDGWKEQFLATLEKSHEGYQKRGQGERY